LPPTPRRPAPALAKLGSPPHNSGTAVRNASSGVEPRTRDAPRGGIYSPRKRPGANPGRLSSFESCAVLKRDLDPAKVLVELRSRKRETVYHRLAQREGTAVDNENHRLWSSRARAADEPGPGATGGRLRNAGGNRRRRERRRARVRRRQQKCGRGHELRPGTT
jgi:hypothetical protein